MRALIEKHIHQPFFQALLVLSAILTFMLTGWALRYLNLYALDRLYEWSVAAAFALLFALLNSLMSLRSDNFNKYWGQSMYSYIFLAFTGSSAAWLISGIPLREAGTYRFIFIVVTFGFLVFLSLVNFMKKIVQFAEREEWNEPRKKSK